MTTPATPDEAETLATKAEALTAAAIPHAPGRQRPSTATFEHAIRIAESLGVREYGPNTRNWSFDYAQLARFVAALTAPQADSQPAPIDMVLHCPACGMQHIDASEPPVEFEPGAAQWSNPPHRSHLCHGCGHIWRPADVPTNGVKAVKTTGKADSPIAARAPADSVTTPAGGGVAGMNEYGVRGYLAATLKCWHRLTGDEAAELVAMTQRLSGLYPCPAHQDGMTGWKWVPVEPTEEMLAAAHDGDREYTLRNFGDVMTVMQGPYDHWAAMIDAAPTPPAQAADSVLEDADPIRALIAQHAAILDQNELAYFELCYHRVTGWMAWITDKPLCMPPVISPDRKVLAQGQGDTADEACRDAARKQGGAT